MKKIVVGTVFLGVLALAAAAAAGEKGRGGNASGVDINLGAVLGAKPAATYKGSLEVGPDGTGVLTATVDGKVLKFDVKAQMSPSEPEMKTFAASKYELNMRRAGRAS